METAYFYLGLSGILTLLLWTPYILARMVVWGIPLFLHNYPEDFPGQEPQAPLWAERSKRAHLDMVETLPAFAAVVLAAGFLAPEASHAAVAMWAQVFFVARIVYSLVYTLGVPLLRTPTYLISWFATLMIGIQIL